MKLLPPIVMSRVNVDVAVLEDVDVHDPRADVDEDHRLVQLVGVADFEEVFDGEGVDVDRLRR